MILDNRLPFFYGSKSLFNHIDVERYKTYTVIKKFRIERRWIRLSLTGWIIYNGNLQGKQFLDYAQWFERAAQQRNIDITLYKNNELLSTLTKDSFSLLDHKRRKIEKFPHFVIFTDKDIYLAKQLEALGMRVFNQAKAIEISDDKILTYQTLAKQSLPIPKTIIAPKIFSKDTLLDIQFIKSIPEALGFPFIVKEAFGSFGEQVYLIHHMDQLQNLIHKIADKPFLFQEFIETSYGTDIRLQVVGDEVVAAMKRKSKNDFRANITAGGTMETYQPTEEEKRIAIEATQAIGADFAGVDLLFGQEGKPIICEINSNAHIRNLYECTQVNTADHVLDYILHLLKT